MRPVQLLRILVPLCCGLACSEPTAPSKPAESVPGTSLHTLVIPSASAMVSAGEYFTCMISATGAPTCRGTNFNGEVAVPASLTSAVQVDVGGQHSCALKPDGTVVCWGASFRDQNNPPAGLNSVVQVSVGSAHACALKTDQTVVCWGAGSPVNQPAGLTATQLASSYSRTCALQLDAMVICWGAGTGEVAQTLGLTSVAQVTVGSAHACAIRTDGSVACEGSNEYGQATVPAGLVYAASISAYDRHTCVVKLDATVACWGLNSGGQTTVPAGLTSVSQVSAGTEHTCALKTDGAVVCWGRNDFGEAPRAGEDGPQPITAGNLPDPGIIGGTFQIVASGGGSGNPIVFSSLTPSICALVPGSTTFNGMATGQATFSLLANGLCTISATQAAATFYLPGARTWSFFVGYQPQTIVFESTPPNPAVIGDVFHIWASGGGSEQPVVFTSLTPSTCDVDQQYEDVTLLANGTCTIAANQAAGGSYLAAAQVTQSFTVGYPQTITFNSTAPTAGYVGDTYSVVVTGGNSGNPVIVSSLSTTVCTVSSTTVSLIGTGTCTVAADQAGGNGYLAAPQATQQFQVMATSLTQTIAFGSTPPNPALVGDVFHIWASGGGSSQPVVFTSLTPTACDVDQQYNDVTLLAPGTCTIAANQSGGGGYLPAPQVTQSFTVGYPQTITFTSTPPGTGYVGGTYTVAATGGPSGSPVLFSSLTTTVCTVSTTTVSLISTGICTVAADQAGGNGYVAAPQATQQFQITGFLTPAQLVQNAITFINQLLGSGGLSSGNASSMKAKLNAASTAIAAGNYNAALGHLNSLLNQLDALAKTGKIAGPEADALRALIDSVIASITP